jgi:NAD+ diphosphatase
LNAVIGLPYTRWLLFNGGQPLLVSPQTQSDRSLEFLSTDDVKPFLGSETYFGQGKEPGDKLSDNTEEGEHSHHSPTQSVRIRGAPIVFLGVHETERDVVAALPTSEFKNPEVAIEKLNGTPYFSLDVAELGLSGDEIRERLEGTLSKSGRTFSWAEPRSLMTTLDPFTAGVFANARSMVDWNFRNKVSRLSMHLSNNLGRTHIDTHQVLSRVWVSDILDVGRMEDSLQDAVTLGR